MELLRGMLARRPLWLALAAGALLGTAARLSIEALVARAVHAPSYVSIAVVNVCGTLFLFGLTARRQRAVARGADTGVTAGDARRPSVSEHAWLLWATGFCGSFTTYSALALSAMHASAGYQLPPSWIDEVPVALPFAIAVGAAMGTVGATLRWRLNAWLTHRFTALQERLALAAEDSRWAQGAHRSAALVPVVGIAIINVLGSGVAGAIAGGCQVVMSAGTGPQWVALVWLCAGSGILGAFTTFSTAVVDAWSLYRQGHRSAGVLMFAGVWLLAWGACLAGYQIAWVSACGAL